MNTTIIGVAGGTASGKSTLVKKLQEAFKGESVITICHDYYYKAHDELSYEERTQLNYDHPSAFDTDMMIADIKKLKEGIAIDCPVYSFVNHNRTDKTLHINPAQVIIIDGILILENQELRDLMDVKVYVDTDADVRILRRILRDVNERGRTLDSIVTQYLTTVKIMHEQFVEPTKRKADLIVPEGGNNHIAIDIITRYLSHRFNRP